MKKYFYVFIEPMGEDGFYTYYTTTKKIPDEIKEELEELDKKSYTNEDEAIEEFEELYEELVNDYGLTKYEPDGVFIVPPTYDDEQDGVD